MVAYLFERFPSFTQTFCYREVSDMRRQGVNAPVFSIRRPDDIPRDCPDSLSRDVRYLPDPNTLGLEMRTLRMLGKYPLPIIWQIRKWGKRPAKARLLEAAWLGPKLRAMGIGHVHAHFAGIAARTAWWLKKFYGITYSFTGHANDMFCKSDSPLSLADLVQDASFVVAVSEFSRDWLVKNVPGHDARIHRIYNGMNIAGFPEAAPPAGRHRIVAVGRYIEKKGFSDLIDACAILRGRDLDFECIIIGGGPMEAALKARVIMLGLENTVILTGPRPQEDVRRELSSASIFVLPCVTESDGGMDTLPTVIVEAMAAGLPVISTLLAAIPEMVENGSTGILIAERQPDRLAESIEQLLVNPELARRFGAAGRRLALERFSSEATIPSLKYLLEQATVAGRRNPIPDCE